MKNPTLLKEMLHYHGRDEMPDDFDTFWEKAMVVAAHWYATDLSPDMSFKTSLFSIRSERFLFFQAGSLQNCFPLGLGIRLVLFSCRKMLEQSRKK